MMLGLPTISSEHSDAPQGGGAGRLQMETGASPYGWVGVRRFGRFFGHGKAARKRRLAWVEQLPDSQKGKADDGAWQVGGDAVLPDGMTVMEFTNTMPLGRLPEEVRRGTDKQRAKYLDAQQVRRLDSQFQRAHPNLAPTTAAYFDKFAEAHGAEVRGLGHSPKRSAMLGYRRDWGRNELTDKRGRSGRKPLPEPDARVCDAYVAVAMHPNFDSYAEAWRHARDVADEFGVPMRSKSWWRRWFQSKYPAWAVQAAKRPRKFESDHLPKIHRTYTEIDPLEWISLDGHVLNIMVQAADAAQTGRKCRPVLTGVLDIRTRLFVGSDIRATENSDGILAGLMQMHQNYGCARHYYADNGKAYKASVGARIRRKLLDDPRIGGLAAQTGAERHNAIPYHGWAKMIESHWRFVVERFERYFPSWWSNCIDARPEDAAKLRVDQCPTLDEVRAAWTEFLKAHHAEPQHGDGMYGLSPNLALEQFRTEVRKLDPDVLEFLCCRTETRRKDRLRKVGRDGVRYAGILYGHFDEQVWRLQGRRVLLRIHPADASFVWVCDQAGVPLCKAHNRQLTGATREEVREAARTCARMKRIAKQYAPARDFLLDTTTTQVMQRRAVHAQRREAACRAELPEPVEPAVTLVRPDLVGAVQEVNRTGRRAALKRAVERPTKRARSGFERLAERARQDEAAEAEQRARPSRAARFAELNYEQEVG